jgi:hypothetical protein
VPRELDSLERGDTRQRSVRRQHLARNLDRALAARPRAELDSQELGVGEGLRTVPVEPLTRPLGLGPTVDRHTDS